MHLIHMCKCQPYCDVVTEYNHSTVFFLMEKQTQVRVSILWCILATQSNTVVFGRTAEQEHCILSDIVNEYIIFEN
jgi:hypothetical protein